MRERQGAQVRVSDHALICKRRHDYGRRLNQSLFQPRAEVSFPHARQFSEYNGKEASASRE